jgi:photosystem II stability/assembly factor-like uncharacterized protein
MKWCILFFASLSVSLLAQNVVMTPLGPEGGIISILNGSLNDEVVIAVVRDNGLFRSTDGGETWHSIVSSALSSKDVVFHDIVFHPVSSDTVFLVTSLGLYRSNNKGVSFSAVPSFPNPQLSMEYSLANPAVLFGSDINGPLKSTDGGNTWITLKDNVYFGNRYVSRIVVHPSDTGNSIRLIAATGFNDSVGLFFSNNSGKNWRPFNKGLPLGKARRIYKLDIDSMGIGKTHFRAVIGTADGIYGAQSDFYDTAWTSLKSNNLPSEGVVTAGVLVYDKFDLTAPPNDQHKFALYYSANASEYDDSPRPFTEKNGLFKIGSKYNTLFTLSLVEPPPIQRVFSDLGDIISLFIPSEANKSKIYLGTTNGIFVSTDDGVTWKRKNADLNHAIVRNIVSLPSVSGTPLLFAGIFGGGIMRSADNGKTWSLANNGMSSPYVVSLAADRTENILYAGTAYTLFRSVDRGQSWSELFKLDSSMILRPGRYRNSSHEITVRFSPVKSTNVLLNSSAAGMWLSTNGGGTWSKITLPIQIDSGLVPESIEFDPADASTIYFTNSGVFKSTDAGVSWTDISSNLPKQAFNPVSQKTDNVISLSPTINPKNTKEMFVATAFMQGDGLPFRVFKTTNGGGSWDPMSSLIPAYDLLYDRLDPLRVVAGGPSGVFRTLNGGSTWKRITDSLSTLRFYLLGEHPSNNNIFYTGSEHGTYRFELTDYPKLTIDTALYDFGSMIIGSDSLQGIVLKNLAGGRNVEVTFAGLTDTVSFHYQGPNRFMIAAGGQLSVPVVFSPVVAGVYSAQLRFTTSDLSMPDVVFTLRGHSFTQYPLEKFSFGFGSVGVLQDSILSIPIPNEGLKKLSITLMQNSDTVNFSVISGRVLTIDTGTVGTLQVQFRPQRAGDHSAVLSFTTSDVRFPAVQMKLFGTAVAKNYLARKVVIDTSFGRNIGQSVLIGDYYRVLRGTLTEAGLNVNLLQNHQYTGNHSIAIVQPSLPILSAAKDSLQRFVATGGTLVLVADHRDSSARLFNTFLRDAGWQNKYGAAAGLQFGQSALFDSSLAEKGWEGGMYSMPATVNRYTLNVDTLLSFEGTYIIVDTTVKNTQRLYSAGSKRLHVRTSAGAVQPFSGPAVTAAAAYIGTGRIITISDPELWWNGVQEDSTNPFGLFGADNLQFALNIFGSIENVVAELKETAEEVYGLISIPYTFQDSTVATLFKGLGEYNSYEWRMFGRYTSTQGYQEYPKDFTSIKRGEGYWLITKEKRKINFGLTSIPGVADDFTIPVNPGFTMIGNPFPYTVSWKNSIVADSVEKVLWSYDNGRYDSTTMVMQPFKGYWVFNRGKLPKTIRINAAPVTTTTVPKQYADGAALHANEWKLRLSLASGNEADTKNFIGVLNNAENGWDAEDFMKPPASPSGGMVLSLQNHGELLSADYRAFNREGHVWNFIVSGPRSAAPLRITPEQIGQIPQEFLLYLIDLKEERMYDLRTVPMYEFSFQKKETARSFRIVAGTSDFLEQHSNGIPVIPLEYSLSQNFPNPFNPTTTIRYTLSNSGPVSLDIYNILGQNVRTLVKERQQIGSYSITWDGKDNHGILLSTGIYYYQIQVNNFRSVKKMTFIK